MVPSRRAAPPGLLWICVLACAGACGDDSETSDSSENAKPRWACVKSSPSYCTCNVVEGQLALSSGQQEVPSCGVVDIETGLGICWQGDETCSCVSYECGADLDIDTCGCFADHWTTSTDDSPVDSCDGYASCCLSPDSELCFCGGAACSSGGDEVESCNAQTVAPILDQRDPTRIRVDVCTKPGGL